MPQSVKCLPLAQVIILGSWDGALHQAPYSAGSLLLPLTATPLAYGRSLSLSLSRSLTIKSKKKFFFTLFI